MSQPERPLCVDCRHYRAWGSKYRLMSTECYHPENLSLVDGKMPRRTPYVLRHGGDSTGCWTTGRWWAPKEGAV